MRKAKASYFTQLMGVHILLVTLPVIILGFAAYLTASHALQEKVTIGNRQNLYQTQMRVENTLKMIDHLALNQIQSPLINEMMKGALSTDDYEKVDQLNDRMNYLQSFDLGVQGWSIVSLANRWLLSDSYSFPTSYQVDTQSLFAGFTSDPRASYWSYQENSMTSAWEQLQRPATLLNRNTITLVKKLPVFTMEPAGLMLLSISTAELGNILDASTKTGDVIILDEKKQVMSHTDVTYSESKMEEILETAKGRLTQPEGGFTVDKNGWNVSLTYRTSEYTGWTYLSIVSIEAITKDSRLIGYYTIVLCALIILVMGLFALQASRKMYSPIRLLFDTISGNMGGHRARRDEFQTIHERFRHLIQSQNRMSSRIETQDRQLSEFYQMKLFLGELTENEISHHIAYSSQAGNWHFFCVLVVQIETLENTHYAEHDRDLLLFAINNIAEEIIPKSGRMAPLVMNVNQVTLLGAANGHEEEFGRLAYHYAEELQKAALTYLKLKISIGISSVFDKLIQAPEAYAEGREALNYRVRFEDQAILYYEEVRPHQSQRIDFPNRLEAELLDAIKLGDMKQIDEKLGELLQHIYKAPMSHQEYQIHLMRLLSELIKLAMDSNADISGYVSGKRTLIDQLQEQSSIPDIAGWFKHTIIEPLVAHIEAHRESLYRSISNAILEMIHEEFATDLKLETCAEKLHYHPGYVSRVFRKETGHTFSDYLAKHRLHVAKTWLVESDRQCSDIAVNVGYQNVRSFNRYFKKTEGVTPGQYRELHQR
ncbi:helix-turn-helix domain-containing protein [Paenibacillus sp. HB172176]|uniref:helix-turn-helix domain-containing protein n=1 Tax=Paenibacillus sp. HB172176 TaxID=2493690 RepID=UPI00143BC4EE|nr:helix-turn-helix domain-containing protein [Paenibacillus sp. HB172176]